MLWGTYFGSRNDVANGIAIGPDGSIWIVGNTTSTNLPTQGALYSSLSGTQDAFVAKFDPTGSDLLFSSYFGAGTTQGLAIALDSQGDPVFSGSTTASIYPTTSGALQTSNLDTTFGSGFVTKLTSTGSAITWSTYLGSNSTQSLVRGLAVSGFSCSKNSGPG